MRRWWTSWYDDGQLMYWIWCWKLWHLILCMLLYQIFHWIKTVIFAKDSVMVTTKQWWSSLLYTVIFTKYNNVVMFTTGFPVRTVARVSLLISSDVHHIVFTVQRLICQFAPFPRKVLVRTAPRKYSVPSLMVSITYALNLLISGPAWKYCSK